LAGDPVWPSYLRTMLARKARQAGIDKRVWLHGLRHHFAVTLAREGHSVRVVQLALGHASLSSTAVYLEMLGAEDAIRAIRGREWSLDDTRHEGTERRARAGHARREDRLRQGQVVGLTGRSTWRNVDARGCANRDSARHPGERHPAVNMLRRRRTRGLLRSDRLA
jgi:hypothetical protein